MALVLKPGDSFMEEGVTHCHPRLTPRRVPHRTADRLTVQGFNGSDVDHLYPALRDTPSTTADRPRCQAQRQHHPGHCCSSGHQHCRAEPRGTCPAQLRLTSCLYLPGRCIRSSVE
eukprot:Hpha_TRINITY_DN31532_c0_g1::TRINITY_DN31532_c0_g1_i1::g.1619::m.1619